MNNFLVVAIPRTGSSALGEAIGLHPDITCGWEWTHFVPARRKIEVTQRALGGDFSVLNQRHQNHMADRFSETKLWLGFRLMFRASDKWLIHPRFSPALWQDRLEAQLQWLRQRSDIHIIHIVRHNNLEWLKSKFLADKTQTYMGKAYSEGIQVSIPLREAVRRAQAKNWVDSRLTSLESSNPYLQVHYEDFLADNDRVMTGAWRFLKCNPPATLVREARLKPQSKGSASSYIANYDAVAGILEQQDLLTARFAIA